MELYENMAITYNAKLIYSDSKVQGIGFRICSIIIYLGFKVQSIGSRICSIDFPIEHVITIPPMYTKSHNVIEVSESDLQKCDIYYNV